jgi:hypothetical protein
MSTGKHWIDASAIRKARRWFGPEDQWITTRMFAAVIASALVLPAFVPDFEAFGLRSSTLFIVGLFILIGFGVPYYALLRCFQEAEETEAGDGKEENFRRR